MFKAEQFEDFARVAHDPECGVKVAAILNNEAEPDDFEAVRDAQRQQYHGWRGSDAIMHAADVLLEGHGIEYIRDASGSAVAGYVNTGATYATTLLYDIERDAFEVTSYGDWVEAYEKENGRLP
jgi:hypothetical protein